MKKVLRVVICVMMIALFSFFKNEQAGSLKKIGKNLYEIKSATALNAPTQARLKTIIARQYDIRSFNETVVVHYVPEKGLKGNGLAMAEQKLSNAAFATNLVEDGDEDIKQACIMVVCSNNPAMANLVQVLSTYNVH